MKYMNIIKLLSVLLCIVMLFTACSNPSNEGEETTVEATETESIVETETETEEALLENVEPTFKNFFDILVEEETESGEAENEMLSAERIDGEIVSSDPNRNFVVLKSVDIDAKNNVTEVYKLYNVVSGEIELSFRNTYFNGDYDELDWNNLMVKETVGMVDSGNGIYVPVENSAKLRDTYLDVCVSSKGRIPYVVVRTATVTPFDEATREEYPDGCVYEIVTEYVYYDVYGNLIAESNSALDIWGVKSSDTISALKFGAALAYFDAETFELLSSDGRYDTDKVSGVYSVENDKYGYFLNNSTFVAGLGYVKYIEIIDKAEGKVAYRYYLNDNYQMSQAFLLHNGDVLIQYESQVNEDDPYNAYYEPADTYCNIAHEIFSVKDGKATNIDLGYYIRSICDGEACNFEQYGFSATANARNIALANSFDKASWGEMNIVVFDNDMSVLYEYEKLVPEHEINLNNGFGVKLLPNGDYLVDLDGVITDKAIVKADGTVRTYIPRGMTVAGEYVYDDKNVYDYDLNVVYALEETSLKVVGMMLGELILVDEDAYDESEYATYYKLCFDEGIDSVYTTSVFSAMQNIEVTDDYVIIRREEDGKYVFLADGFTSVLVTYDEMDVYSFDGGYIAITEIEGQTVLYQIN